MKIVCVTWLDSTLHGAQLSAADAIALKPSLCCSVGYVVQENLDPAGQPSITIARDLIDDELRGVLVIPQVCISTVEELRGSDGSSNP